MAHTVQFQMDSIEQTERLGRALARSFSRFWNAGLMVYLHGDLGAGKTTLSKYIIAELGHTGAVKSPTYTLVEPYVLPGGTVYHFDLYRLGDPEELEFIGGRDYFASQSLCLIEWAERGAQYLAQSDIELTLGYAKHRMCSVHANTVSGTEIIKQLQGAYE